MQIRLCHSPAWNCPGLQTKALGGSHGPSRFAPSGFFSVTRAAPSLHFSLGSDPAALCSSNMSCFLSLLAFEPKTSLCWDLPLSLLSCSWKEVKYYQISPGDRASAGLTVRVLLPLSFWCTETALSKACKYFSCSMLLEDSKAEVGAIKEKKIE